MKTPNKLTSLEARVMDAVWHLSEATVHQVRDYLESGRKPLAYNTVLTVMRILRDKGFLESRRDGRADVYSAVVSREAAGRRSLSDVLDWFFSGSATALVSQLLDSEKMGVDEMQAIRRTVDARLARTKETECEEQSAT